MREIITFLRHGKADTHKEDIKRPLSEVGIQQAATCRTMLERPAFDVVLASPALRTIATVAIVAGVPEDAVFPVQQMYPDPKEGDGAVIDALFNKLGYAPLAAYLAEPEGQALTRYGELVWSVLKETLGRAEGHFLVGGHAVLTPAIGVAACADVPWHATSLLSANMGECCGFRLYCRDWMPRELHVI